MSCRPGISDVFEVTPKSTILFVRKTLALSTFECSYQDFLHASVGTQKQAWPLTLCLACENHLVW